jgi:probable DNA metabolism protein
MPGLNMVQVFTYNGTFEGFLTVVFECYRQKVCPADIRPKDGLQQNIFSEAVYIEPDSAKAARVWKGIHSRLSGVGKDMPFYSFLSESDGIEIRIFRFIRRLLSEQFSIETDFSDPDVLFLIQVARQVKKEAMRMVQFVRFQRTNDGLYFCGIEPKYDVIPLVLGHYKRRFPSQKWIIYDLKRDYGIFYDLKEATEVVFSKKEFSELDGALNKNLVEEGEDAYQSLWRTYFQNVNIKERKNLKLQRQHMPQRFWKFLPEMQNNL